MCVCVFVLFPQWGTYDEIASAFRKFGAIEKIEIFKEKYPAEDEADESYAYITYVDSMSVYHALRSAKGLKSGLQIVPADTWKQPAWNETQPQRLDDRQISLNVLNEYCLLDIFNYFDLNTLIQLCNLCDRFSTIIHQRVFPKFKKIDFDFRRRAKVQLTISSFCETLLHIGRHIVDATIYFDMYEDPPNAVRIIDVFTKYVGESIERLELNRVPITERGFQQLKPIFGRIKELKWIFDDLMGELEIDFVHTCPKVQKLYFDHTMRFDLNADRWPSLEEAYLDIFDFVYGESYPLFFKNNSQLKRLTMVANTYDYEDLIEPICEYLLNLEQLTICYADQGQASQFEPLVNLSQLKSLKLKFLALDDVNPNAFFRLFGSMPALNHLALYFYRDTYDDQSIYMPHNCQLAAMAENLVNLQRFELFGYTLTENTFMEFIKNARQLIEFRIIECELTITESTAQRIVDIRKRQARRNHRDIVPLALFVKDPIDVNAEIATIVTVNLNKVGPIGGDE